MTSVDQCQGDRSAIVPHNGLLQDPGWNDRENARRRRELDAAGTPFSFQDLDDLERRELENRSREFISVDDRQRENLEHLMSDVPSDVRARRIAGERGVSSGGARGKMHRRKKVQVPGRPRLMPNGEPLEYTIEAVAPVGLCTEQIRPMLYKFARRDPNELAREIATAKIELEASRIKNGKRGAPSYYGGAGKPISMRITRSILSKIRSAADPANASWTHVIAAALAA